ncbi:hypothetical protein DFH08DRAFT_1023484 [Mycena albidolilacea]|uniref:Uncharacterized protein n=1 Tax=Mycena albidolilacea TaxID=1033008 RepID=A0AAD6ZNN3_9AGAR|nr:hypothetical protein DFH08DRAFT_1023484 [Mycena albidolilacea]
MERAGVKHFALAPMDMARDWLFSMRKLGLQTGFIPIDLHDSVGVRTALGVGPHSHRMVSGRLRGQWLALRRHLSFPSLRKLTLRAEDDDGFAPMAKIRAVLDRTARTLRHLRHPHLTHLDVVDTRISGLVLGRVAHASALVSLTLHGTFEDVKGASVTFAGDHVLDEGEGGGRQHTLLPHLHSFRFLLVGDDDQHPLYAAVAAFLARRPLLRRLDLGSCPWELVRNLLPTLSGLKVLGVRIAHFNSAPAQGLWGGCAAAGGARTAFDDRRGGEGPDELLSTCFLPLPELVFETLPLEILSFLTRTLFSPKPSPLPPSLGARVARAFPHLQRYKRELKASVTFGTHLSYLLIHSPPLRPPSLTLSYVLFCLPLPDPARELEAQRALVLPFAASSCEHCQAGLWRFGQGKTICLSRPSSLTLWPFPLPPLFLPSVLVNPPPLPHSLFFFFLLSSIHPLQTTHYPCPPSQNEHAPALRAFPALAFLHLQNAATHRPKPSLVSEREFAQQTEGWVAAARGVARALPGLDFWGGMGSIMSLCGGRASVVV